MADHPPPWRWRDAEVGRPALEAADGSLVLYDEGDGIIVSNFDPRVAPGVRARVRALIAAAPEMEALLREEMEAHGMCIFCGPVGDPMSTHPGHRHNKIRALLSRIDAAKASGS